MNQISHLILPDFKLFSPTTIEEALTILEENQTQAKILAGGTDLLIELRQRLTTPAVLIDVKNIPELIELKKEGNNLVIGAAVPIVEILKSEEVKKNFKALYMALNDMCDEILRFRATIGGNLGTSSPAADTAGPLMIHRAKIIVQSKASSREIPIEEFFIGVKQNSLKSNEMIVAIHIPIPANDNKSTFHKLKRSSEDLALIGVSAVHGKSETLLAFTALAPTPILVNISHIITEKEILNERIFKELWKVIEKAISPIDDIRSSREYRLHMTEILTRKALVEVSKR